MESFLDIAAGLCYNILMERTLSIEGGYCEKSFRRTAQGKRHQAGGIGGSYGGFKADHWLIGKR